MKCPKCGQEVLDGAVFCGNCGVNIKEASSKAEQPKEAAADGGKQECPHCHKLISAKAKFCPACGQAITGKPGEPAGEEPKAPETPTKPDEEPAAAKGIRKKTTAAKKAPKKHKGLVIAVCIAIAAALALAGWFVLKPVLEPKVEVSDYLTVEVTGYNGYGTAKASFDKDKFMKDWDGKIKYSDKLYQIAEKTGMTKEAVDALAKTGMTPAATLAQILSTYTDFVGAASEYLTGDALSTATKLSNGDSYTFSWDTLFKDYSNGSNFFGGESGSAELVASLFKNQLVFKDVTVKVADLKELEDLDLFDGLTVSFQGFQGIGFTQLATDSGKAADLASKGFSYYTDSSNDGQLSNGDTVTVKVKIDSLSGELTDQDAISDYCAENLGAKISAISKDYTVSGLKDIASSAAGLKIKVLVADLRIRDTPSTSGTVKGTAAKGQVYTVYDVSVDDKYTWYEIGADQWVAGDPEWVEVE